MTRAVALAVGRWSLLSLMLVALCAARPLAAADGDTIVKKMSGKLVVAILDELGYRNPMLHPPKEEGDPEIVEVKTEGRKVLLFVPAGGISVQGHFATKDVPGDLKKVNDWNRNSFFTKACVLSDGSACLSSDIAVEGGVTKAAITKQLEFFLGEVGKFYRKMEEK